MNDAAQLNFDRARELKFLLRDRTALAALALLLALSVVAVLVGVLRVSMQEDDIARMIVADSKDRAAAQVPITDYGDAAYYSFYVTYDAPAPLAFAAMGQRDTAPYLKRIRLLALEGQIYNGDSPNPLLAKVGSLDLSFVAAYVLPLILIVLLYNLKSSEQTAGRLMFLEAMPDAPWRLWIPRIAWRTVLAYLAIASPLTVAAYSSGVDLATLVSALLGLAMLTLFWASIAALLALVRMPSAAIGAALVGLWLVLNVVVPAMVQNLVVPQVDGPDGADIALLQREAVNDAWDLPKSTTLEPFAELFPQYAIGDELKPFDWRWYFAFQHMGDVAAIDVSKAYRDAIRDRDRIASQAAWVSPGLAIQRHLQGLAHTDVTAQLAYDAAIRRYHAQLQAFYLPLVFGDDAYDSAILKQAPRFSQ